MRVRTSPGVVASFRPKARRAALLGAAGLVLGPAAALASTGAEADAEAPTVSPVVVTAKTNPLAADTGLAVMPQSVQDTPQAVQVIDARMLKEQNVTSLEQALRNAPGITIAIGEGGTLAGDQFKIRGFDAKDDVYVDGLRDFGVYTRDSFNYEEVQILKGPSGAAFGRGTVGGAINTVSKTARLRDFGEAGVSVGSAEFGRATLDLNKALNGATAVRLNLMAQSNHVVDRDVVRTKKWGAAASVGFGLGTDTSLTATYLHQHTDLIPDYGIVVAQRPGELVARPASEYGVGVSRSAFLGYDQDRDRNTADTLTVRFVHRPMEGVTLTSDSRVGVYSRYFQYTSTDQCNAACNLGLFDNNPATPANAGMGGGGPYDQDAWGVQNLTALRFDQPLAGHRNRLIVGADSSYNRNKRMFYAYTLPAGITARNLIPRDLTNLVHSFPAGYSVYLPSAANVCPVAPARACSATAATALNNDGDSTDVAAFVSEQFWLTPEVSVLVGLRGDRFDSNFEQVTVGGTRTLLKAKSSFASPRASLIWEPSETRTFYLSYGKAASPQGTSTVGSATALSATTKDLEPEVAETWEAGAKVAWWGGRLSTTASVFDVKKSNAKQADPSTGFVQAQSGQRQEVKGIELAATGRINPKWSINAAYTYLDSKILDDNSCGGTPVVCNPNRYTIGQAVAFVPKNSASLWTTYDLGDWIEGLGIGGGVTYQSAMNVGYTIAGTAPNPTGLSRITQIPESLSFDGVVSYRTGAWRVAVNGYNLADRLNYSQVFGNRGTPAAGRTIVASLSREF